MVANSSIGYYNSLDFNAPMTGATADLIVRTLATTEPVEILDIGCGWAELLLRVVAASPAARGHGIDHDEALIARATRNTAARSLSDRVTFSVDAVDARPSDIVVCIGSEQAFGSLGEALSKLRGLVRPGGRLLLGTLFWEQPPTPEQAETFGDLPVLGDLAAGTAAMGWRPLGLTVATARDWDHFEFGFIADWETAVMTPVDVEESDRARRMADEYRERYLARRGVLGFAFLTLGRPHVAPIP
jgi:SAM-dependent methyltransferase